MEKNTFQYFADNSPFGFGYCELIYNDRGEAEDCVFREANSDFEALAGLQSENIIGRRGSELFDNQSSAVFNWSFLKEAVNSSALNEMAILLNEQGRHLKVKILSKDRKNLAVFVQGMTEAMDALETSGQQDQNNNALLQELEIIFNSTHDAISLVGIDGGEFRYIRSNAMHQKLTGIDNISGKTPEELVGKEVGGMLRAHYNQCLSTGKPVTYEQTFDFVTGKQTWLTNLNPVFDQGEIRYLVGSSKDITEIKAIQKEKEALTRRLQTMFNQHNAIMLLVDPVSGKIVDANPAASDFYGYSRKELLRLRIEDINMLPADEVKKRREMAYKKEQHYFVFPHRLKNGTIRPVDVFACPVSDGENTLLFSIIFDVSDRERYRAELYNEKELLRTTLKSIGDGVVTTDIDGMITSLNDVAQELTGWNMCEAQGKPFKEVFRLKNETTGDPAENPISKVLETGRIVGLANHTVLVNRQSQEIPIADSAAPIMCEDGNAFGVVMVFRDVSKEKEQNEHILYLSYHDPLTGLYNRRYIEEAMSKLDIREKLPISVIMGDVNGLKLSNDVFGHEAGDALLIEAAEILKKCCRENDLIARWGGDEFLILMTYTDAATAEKVVQRIKATCEIADESPLKVSLSLGYATKEQPEVELRSVMRKAEEYMYHHKLLDGKSYRNAIISTLLATLYEKSIETEEHTKRLEALCQALGKRLKLQSKEKDELSLLALLHDIGKVGISRSVLQKPGKLTTTEWDEMKQHPAIGYRIARATPELAVAAEYILSHHERWDGNGYPQGLKGDAIPLICRILAVIDAFDAMTNDRVYRNAMSQADAIKELKDNSGTQFDPDIVALFLDTVFPDQPTD